MRGQRSIAHLAPFGQQRRSLPWASRPRLSRCICSCVLSSRFWAGFPMWIGLEFPIPKGGLLIISTRISTHGDTFRRSLMIGTGYSQTQKPFLIGTHTGSLRIFSKCGAARMFLGALQQMLLDTLTDLRLGLSLRRLRSFVRGVYPLRCMGLIRSVEKATKKRGLRRCSDGFFSVGRQQTDQLESSLSFSCLSRAPPYSQMKSLSGWRTSVSLKISMPAFTHWKRSMWTHFEPISVWGAVASTHCTK